MIINVVFNPYIFVFMFAYSFKRGVSCTSSFKVTVMVVIFIYNSKVFFDYFGPISSKLQSIKKSRTSLVALKKIIIIIRHQIEKDSIAFGLQIELSTAIRQNFVKISTTVREIEKN